VEIRSFLGIHNTSPIRSIPNNALSSATDVDIDDSGILTQRNGYALSNSIANVTSAYSTKDQTGYLVASGTLYRVLEDATLVPLVASKATQFTDFQKVLFTNDGYKIDGDSVTHLGIPAPSTAAFLTQPEVSSEPGFWPAGIYNVTYTFRSKAGLEGGSAPISTITLPENSEVVVAPIVAPVGYTVNVYMTDAGGSVYYDSKGIQLNPVQELSAPFPEEADLVAYFHGSLYCTIPLPSGSTLVRYSIPYYFHLFDYVKDYFIVHGEVRGFMAAQDALLIGTDSAVYAYTDAGLTTLADYGVVKGRPFTKMPDESVYMHTKRGVCRGLPFENLTETKALFPIGVQCSTALVQQDGINKFVALSDGSGKPHNTRF
jgi:hypothetical protein